MVNLFKNPLQYNANTAIKGWAGPKGKETNNNKEGGVTYK